MPRCVSLHSNEYNSVELVLVVWLQSSSEGCISTYTVDLSQMGTIRLDPQLAPVRWYRT